MIKKSTFFTKAVFTFLLFLVVTKSNAQFSITSTGTANTWNFDGLQSSGTTHAWANSSTIPGFYNARQTTPFVFASYTVGTGSSNSGQLYSFGSAAAPDRALGSVCSGTPGNIAHVLRLVNNTGSFVSSIVVTFTGEQWRDGGAVTPNAQPLSFYYKVSSTATTTFDVTATGFTSYSPLTFISPTFANTGTGTLLDGNLTANKTSIIATITVSCAVGDEIYLKWIDINDIGNDHGLAIDDLSVTAIAGTASPEINIISGATNYLNNSTYNFGTVNTSTTNVATFTIQNTGASPLNITTLTIGGGAEFNSTSDYPIPMTIAAGGFATFTTSYTPTVTGTHTGSITFATDDADEANYVVNFLGVATPPQPEINIVQDATNYLTGSTFDFGTRNISTTTVATFAIQNTGLAPLNLTTGTFSGGAEYNIISDAIPATVAAGGVFTLTIEFTPTATGTYSGQISISNNDTDENPYILNITGIGAVLIPDIFTETFGNPSSTTLITSYTGWSNPTLTFTGTGDVRSTTASTSYTGASGQGNVFLTFGGTKNIEISNINTSTCSSFTLSFGVLKSAQAEDGSGLLVEVSSDGISYTPLTFPALPTGVGTTGWYYRTASGVIPQAANLRIRFTNTIAATTQFRIDDIKLQGVCAPSPEINVRQGVANYLSGSTYSFGTVNTSTTNIATFTIQNVGTAALNITTITIGGSIEFSSTSDYPIPMTIAAGGFATFTTSYTPTVAGTHTGSITFATDDADEANYVVNFSGVAITPMPEMNIIQGATNLASGTTYNFGSRIISTTTVATFAVQNTGVATLNLTTATFSGGSEYNIISDAIPTTVAPGGVFTITIEFTPTAAGTYTGQISISSNDADENPYLLNITGIGTVASTPEIDVVVASLNFGSIEENTTADLTYTVQNTGTANLVLSTSTSAPYSIIGTAPTTITAGTTATYTVRFAPTAAGTYNVNLAITSNDADEATVNIALSGIATVATPAIFTETFGNPTGTTLITSYNGWSNPTLTFTGTGDIRNTTASTSYTGASGQGNVFLTSGGTKNIEISNINTSTCSSFTLSFGVLKSAQAEDGSGLLVEVSSDGISYTPLTFPALPTGAGTTGWYYRTASGVIPQAANLRIRFTNTIAATTQFRIDDIKLQGVCAPAPEINLTVNSTNQANNTSFDFGTVAVGGTYTATFAIENTGTIDLNVSSGITSNSTEFSINGGTPPFIIAAGNMLTFTMEFTPTVTGTYSNILTLVSDDADESTYTVTFNGNAVTPQPEINLMQAATNYLTGSTYTFPNTTVATSATVVFTMQNTGTADLTVSNVTTSGVEFSSSIPSSFTITPGNSLTFSTTFSSTSVGTYNGNISFTNNDANEGTYVLNFTGVIQNAPAPEINVVATTLNFGSIEANTTADLIYTVQNTGNADLVLSTSTTSPYSIVGTAATTITAGTTATYTVRFSPTAIGTFTANVTITSNDADEPSLTIALTGVATTAMPAIFTETFGTPTANTAISSYTGWSNPTLTFTGTGDVRTTSPSTYTGASGSGNVFLSNSGGPRTIEISNINTSSCTALSLSFGILKSVSGSTGSELLVEVSADGTNYTALTFPALPAGTSWNYVTTSGTIPQATNLRIRFTNTSATVFFRIDDVKLKGNCGAIGNSEINITDLTNTYVSGSTYDFGTVGVSTTNIVTFRIENTGTADLNVSTSLSGGAQYAVAFPTALPTTIASGTFYDFTVTFSAAAVGTYTGFVTINCNDADESAYSINFTGIVAAAFAEINIKQGATSIASGGSHAFGSTTTSTNVDVVFTIENTGTSALNIVSNSITGSVYSLVGAMPSSIAAGTTADFTVRLNSATAGSFVGSITLNNNDSNEGVYSINFTGDVVTSITELEKENNLIIYPNPNNGNELFFNKTINVTIVNTLGAKVIEADNVSKVDVSKLENGLYFVTTNENKVQKLIITK